MPHLQNTDGQGHLLVGEHLSPVSYHVSVTRSDEGYSVRVTTEAPRDWLIKQGFQGTATLVLSGGGRVQLSHDGPVDVGQSLTLLLEGDPLGFGDQRALAAHFPEVDIEQIEGTSDEDTRDHVTSNRVVDPQQLN